MLVQVRRDVRVSVLVLWWLVMWLSVLQGVGGDGGDGGDGGGVSRYKVLWMT